MFIYTYIKIKYFTIYEQISIQNMNIKIEYLNIKVKFYIYFSIIISSIHSRKLPRTPPAPGWKSGCNANCASPQFQE